MTLLNGKITNREPLIAATIDKKGDLVLSSKGGEHSFVVDTGFTGDLAVPRSLLHKMKLKFLSYDKFELATKRVIDLPVFQGWVKVKNKRVKVEIIPGDELIGMGLLEAVSSKLILDWMKQEIRLIDKT